MTKKDVKTTLDNLPQTGAKKKTDIPSLTVPDAVMKAVDSFVDTQTKVKVLEDLAAAYKGTVVSHVAAEQERLGLEGAYSKSFRLEGHSASLTYTRTDKFGIAKNVTIKDLEEAAGKKFVKENFTATRTLQVQADVMKEPAKLAKLVEILKAALGDSMGEYFEQETLISSNPGLDTARLQLEPEKRAKLDALATQAQPGLKL